MKLTIKTSQIKKLLGIAKKFIPKCYTLPILGSIVIEAKNNCVTFKSTDMDKRQTITIKNIDVEDGFIVFDLKSILNSLKYMCSPEVVIQKNNQGIVSITGGDQFFELGESLPIDDYVSLLGPKDDGLHIKMKQENLIKGINNTHFAILPKNFSPVFTAMCIRYKTDDTGSYLIFVGTDSYRLSEYKIKINVSDAVSDHTILIPYDSLAGIKDILSYIPGENIEIVSTEKYIFMSYENDDYSIGIGTMVIQSKFPEYDNEKIIPTVYSGSILFNKSDLKRTLNSISSLSNSEYYFSEISYDGEKTVFYSENDSKIKYSCKLQTSVVGNTDKMAVNCKHINQFISINKSDTIKLEHNGETSPILITAEDKCHRYIIRPCKK